MKLDEIGNKKSMDDFPPELREHLPDGLSDNPTEFIFTVHDLTSENYWFTHKKNTYSIPYPSVKTFFYYVKLLENVKENPTKDEIKYDNYRAFWLLYHDAERIYQNIDIPLYQILKDIYRIKKWKVKAGKFGDMMGNINQMLGLERKAKPSDYGEEFGSQDMIIGIAQKFGWSFEQVLNMKMPAFACILNYNDTVSYVEEKMYESNSES